MGIFTPLHSRLLLRACACGLCSGRYKCHVYSYYCPIRYLSVILKATHEPFTSFACLPILTNTMSFQASSRDIFLEDGHILFANVCDRDGNWVESRIDLNEFIGNEDGWFMWDGVSTCCLSPPLLLWSNYHTTLNLFYYAHSVLDYMLLFDQTVRYKQLLTEIISQTFLIQPTIFV